LKPGIFENNSLAGCKQNQFLASSILKICNKNGKLNRGFKIVYGLTQVDRLASSHASTYLQKAGNLAPSCNSLHLRSMISSVLIQLKNLNLNFMQKLYVQSADCSALLARNNKY
jgi:hypothetical protein